MTFFLKTAFVTIYAFWKIPLSNLEKKTSKNVYKFILILLTILSLTAITVVVLPFAIYRFLIWFYLKLKHGDDLLKVLNFVPSSFFMVKGDYATMRMLLICESEDGDSMRRIAKDVCRKLIENIPEYTSVVKKCSGYYYLLKKPHNLEETFITVSFNDGTLLNEEKISRYYENSVLTNDCLFRFVFFTEPLRNNRYVMLLMVHHGISDGHGIWLAGYKYVFDKETLPIQNNLPVVKQQLNLNDPYVDANTLRNLANYNEPSTCKQAHFAMFLEEELSCIPKLKVLRKRFNCSFNELFLSIITFTLYCYTKRSFNECSNNMLMGYVHHFQSDYQNHFRNMIFPTNDISNNTYLLTFNVENLNTCNCVEDFIQCIRKKSQEAVNSVLLQASYALSKGVFDFIPDIFYRNKLIRQLTQPILVFSNTGMSKGISIGGKPLLHISGGIASGGNGIYAAIITYNDRLNFTLSSKSDLFKSQEEIQAFMKSCIECLHELYDNVTSYSH